MLIGIHGGEGKEGEGDFSLGNANCRYRFSFPGTSWNILYSLICPSAPEISKKAIENEWFSHVFY